MSLENRRKWAREGKNVCVLFIKPHHFVYTCVIFGFCVDIRLFLSRKKEENKIREKRDIEFYQRGERAANNIDIIEISSLNRNFNGFAWESTNAMYTHRTYGWLFDRMISVYSNRYGAVISFCCLSIQMIFQWNATEAYDLSCERCQQSTFGL